MLEEKELNRQDSLDVNVTSSEINNNDVMDNIGQSVDAGYSVPSQNAFLYMDSSVYTPVETPAESLDVFEQDSHDAIQKLNPVNVNENINPETFSLNENVDSNDNINSAVVTEETVVLNEQSIIEKQNSAGEAHEIMDSDLKSNLIFMVVFVIIILAVIFALPYISGYN